MLATDLQGADIITWDTPRYRAISFYAITLTMDAVIRPGILVDDFLSMVVLCSCGILTSFRAFSAHICQFFLTNTRSCFKPLIWVRTQLAKFFESSTAWLSLASLLNNFCRLWFNAHAVSSPLEGHSLPIDATEFSLGLGSR